MRRMVIAALISCTYGYGLVIGAELQDITVPPRPGWQGILYLHSMACPVNIIPSGIKYQSDSYSRVADPRCPVDSEGNRSYRAMRCFNARPPSAAVATLASDSLPATDALQ